MRLLWVKAEKLLPLETGGRIRSFNLLRQLAARHELVVLSYYSGDPDAEYDDELRRQFPGAIPLCTAEQTGSAIDYLRRFWSVAPYAVTKHTSPVVSRRVGDLIGSDQFDVAICDFLAPSLNFPKNPGTPCLLFQHNVESLLWQRQATCESKPIKRLVFSIEAAKMKMYERSTVRRFPHIVAVSEADRAAMSAMTDPACITVVPTGVDLRAFGAAAGLAGEPNIVTFLGSMDWEANVDGVSYFCREIWPLIQTEIPEARFRIVGRNPVASISGLASESIEVTGRVKSVIDYLAQTAVFVVPLRVGGGTRLKIFEAMAAGRAVVSTPVGAEGLDVVDGQDLLLADDPRAFARAVIDLLRNPERRRELGVRAAACAAQYDWSTVVGRFESALELLTSTTPDSPPRAARLIPAAAPDR